MHVDFSKLGPETNYGSLLWLKTSAVIFGALSFPFLVSCAIAQMQ